MYITGIKIFLNNKLLGVGPRQFRNVCDDYQVSKFSCQSHPQTPIYNSFLKQEFWIFYNFYYIFNYYCFFNNSIF